MRASRCGAWRTVLLPAGTFAETSGPTSTWRGAGRASPAPPGCSGAARPAWKILRVLGKLLELPGFDYQSSEQVRDELRTGGCGAVEHRRADAAVPIRQRRRAAPTPAALRAAEPVLDVPMYAHRSGATPRRFRCSARATGGAAQQRYGGAAHEHAGGAVGAAAGLRALDRSSRCAADDPADPVGRLPDAVGAQAHRLDADALRPQPRAHLRPAARHGPAVRRRHQAADQGDRGPGARQQGAVRAGTGHHADSGVRRLGGGTDRAAITRSPTSMPGCCTCCR